MRIHNLVTLVGSVVFATACGRTDKITDPGPVAYCSAVAPTAIAITVRDSASGRALADSASGSFRVATLIDTLIHWDSLTLAGGRQTGTYDVSVQRAGYRPWTRSGVQATKTGVCGGVETVKLTAGLQPL